MPTYVYKREDGTLFENDERMTDERLKVCPTTGQKVTQVFTKPIIDLRGDGFFRPGVQ